MRKTVNMEKWIQRKANDISLDRWECDFCDLPLDEQVDIHNQAIKCFARFMTDLIDRAIKDASK